MTSDVSSYDSTERVKARILVIDDDISIIKLVVATLKDDFDVVFAKDSSKAQSLLATDTVFDLILLDVNLPELGGFELCHLIKQMPARQEIPVIFVTSRSSVDDKIKGFELGAVDFVTKPIEYPILKARVRTHVTLRQQKEQLRALSLTDPLTNLPNKRAYLQTFQAEFNEARQQNESLGLIVLDVDHFKAYNDNYGHDEGDRCLKRLAKILQRSMMHSSETAFRYGGEEFTIVVPRASQDIINNLAQRVIDNLKTESLPHAWSNCADYLTVSMGAFVGNVREFEQASDIFEIADKKLYQAKQNGRACLVI